MYTSETIKKTAVKTIEEEASMVLQLKEFINDDFSDSINLILSSHGRVIVTGIGKSAHIGQKMVATFNSTGTPSVFMHAADAIHGDIGIIQKDDVVICISKSGNTNEIKVLIPLIKMLGNKIIAMVGNSTSYLAENADLILLTTVEKEVCPNNLAPTSSTTAQLVMGDAIAVCLLQCRGFSREDFARLHPGGMIGKNLYLKVEDLMKHNAVPVVNLNSDINSVILEMTTKRLGATAVVDKNNKLAGIITDGDLRRMLEKTNDINQLKAGDIASMNPKTVSKDMLAVKSLSIMKAHNITQLIVSENREVVGFIHLHDILREGII
ncbi:MAG: KpsF/GutQ family sugar-phosphate isomerase [Bacteroidales bacterium]|nr:KpsF/GutQ family sugar-phosphate isomerase [Bacteroidales bacterium]